MRQARRTGISTPERTTESLPLRPRPQAPLEVWGGVECTVNRVGDRYFDQLVWNHHASHPEDLDRFAALGLRTLRYPILWERVAPEGVAGADWSWPDERLDRLRALGIRPIVGLVHHGSGPRTTNLCDPSFATGLAAFAGAVAARYPWVTDYTPVNEPLTTARFSALYGHWYPHARDGGSWARAMVSQCRATVLAMQAIRAVNPGACLIQTDDLGKTYSTPALAYQAEFENERRWLTWDLLSGRVGSAHRMWQFLTYVGIPERDLDWFRENRCPPDIIGVNSYPASVRFLDERVGNYPDESPGGNGRDTYVDVLAARVVRDLPAGPYAVLREAWERYRCPIAITEAHNSGAREEQLRWFTEVWRAAERLRAEGADVRAVTVWSLLGVFNWNVLLTRTDGAYEPGAFDLRAPQPRPTAVAAMTRAYATDGAYDHPVLDSPGWWRRPERFSYPLVPPVVLGINAPQPPASVIGGVRRLLGGGRGGNISPLDVWPAPATARPILITGASGTLGRAFVRLCRLRALAHHPLTHGELDITDVAAVQTVLATVRPWAVINAAGYERMDDAEHEADVCMFANADGPAILATACAAAGIALLTFSSALVFGGERDTPYVEHDLVAPQSVYGHSKAEAERRVLAAMPHAFVVRTGPLFGPWDETKFVSGVLRFLAQGQPVIAAEDVVISPTYVPPFVHTCLDLLVDGERGIWHLANTGAVSWAELARAVAHAAGLDPQRIEGQPAAACGFVALRPAYSALGSERGTLLPSWEESVRQVVQETAVAWRNTGSR